MTIEVTARRNRRKVTCAEKLKRLQKDFQYVAFKLEKAEEEIERLKRRLKCEAN